MDASPCTEMSLNSDLEVTARCYQIRSAHVHSSKPRGSEQDLEDLLSSCQDPWLLFNESSIAPLRHIARCHGLPRAYAPPLLLVLSNTKDNHKFVHQLVLLLKYAQAKDSEFFTIHELLQLLKNYPAQEVAAKKEFFVLDIVTQLHLIIAQLVVTSDYSQLYQNARNELEACKSYLPCVNAKVRTQIKGTFERVGLWTTTSSSTSQFTSNDFNLNDGAMRNGEQLIRCSHEKAASKVSAHVVKTQQTQAITTEENVSEKTQMQNIKLSNSLAQARAKCSSSSKQLMVGEAKRNQAGSDRSWYKSTGWELSNFHEKACGKNVIKDDDITYLMDKLNGFKFTIFGSGRDMVDTIAETFAMISEYQKLETTLVAQLLNKILAEDRSNGHYDQARENILKMTEFHCARLIKNREGFPREIHRILSQFKDDSSCTTRMRRTIWRILMGDQVDPSVNFEHTFKMLAKPGECEEALDYINQIVLREENWAKLKKIGLISALTNIVMGSAPAQTADDKIIEMELAKRSETVDFNVDTFSDCYIPGRKLHRNLAENNTFSMQNIFSLFSPVSWILDATQSIDENLKHEKFVKNTPHKDITGSAQKEYSAKARIKAVALLELHLTLQGSQGLDVQTVAKFMPICAKAEGAGPELSSPIIRCILHTIDKNAADPEFFRKLPSSVLPILFATSSCHPDKKLQIFTLSILSNLLNHKQVSQWVVEGIRHVDFLRDKLLRRDIIYHSSGRVILEEELAKEFDFSSSNESGQREFSCVSAIVARIFVASLQSKANICDESTISLASRALFASPDKMTRIYCAEYLFGAADSGTSFTLPVLNDLRTFLFDPVADVRIHACAAYCTALANHNPAPLDHISYLPNVYTFKTVLLDDKDFTPYINTNILRVIRAAADVHFLPEPVFHLLTLVLNSTCADSQESQDYATVQLILESIEAYCALPVRAETLPSAAMDAVENLLLESDVFDEQCARIVERCMMASHWVSDVVLEEFAKYLFYAPEVALPFLRRLYLANTNQDLPPPIFLNMEMELTGLRMWPEAWPDGLEFLKANKFEHINQEQLLRNLMDHLANGKLLSPLNVSVFEHLLQATEEPTNIQKLVVECLTMAGANGQGLSKSLIKLALSSAALSPDAFELAIVVVQTNQQLPKKFLDQVFSTIADDSITDASTIQLVMNMIMRNFELPPTAVRGYCQTVLQECQADVIPKDLMSSLVKLVQGQMARSAAGDLFKEAFLRAVENKDSTVAELGFKGISLLGKELISSQDIQRLSRSSHASSLRASLSKLYENSQEMVWIPPDPNQVPQSLLIEVQGVIEQSRLGDFKLELSEKWMRAVKHLFCQDEEAAPLMKKIIIETDEEVHPIEIQIAQALCHALLNSKNAIIKTNCKGALSALVQRGAQIQPMLSLFLSFSQEDEDRKWELQTRGEEEQFLADLRAWQLNPTKKLTQDRLSRHLQDTNLRQVYYKEIAEAPQKVDKALWKDVPELAHACAENLLCTGKAFGACAELIEDHILLSTDALSYSILGAYAVAVKTGQNSGKVLPVVQKCTQLLSTPTAPREILSSVLQICLEASRRRKLPQSALDAVIINCITSQDPWIRGTSFAILLHHQPEKLQARTRSFKRKVKIPRELWEQIYYQPLGRIYKEIYGSAGHELPIQHDELNDKLLLLVYSSRTSDLRRLKNVPREEWFQILMASDLVHTFASSIDDQVMIQPHALKIVGYMDSSNWSDFVQNLTQFFTQNSQLTVQQGLNLVARALEAANQDEVAQLINAMSLKELALTDFMNYALSKLLERRVDGITCSLATKFVHELLSVLNIGLIYKTICSVKNSMDKDDLEDFVSFSKTFNKPVSSALESVLNALEEKNQLVELSDILQSLQLRILMVNVPRSHAQCVNIENHLSALLTARVSYNHLHQLLEMIASNSVSFLTAQDAKISALENVLYQMSNYGACPEWFPAILEGLGECQIPQNWIQRGNSLTMERVFPSSSEKKGLEELLKEFSLQNLDIFTESTITPLVGKISSGAFKSSICPDLAEICKWKEEDIGNWALAAKVTKDHRPECSKIEEGLCVAKRACYLFKNYHLTDIQILAIISSLKKSDTRGLLLQVSTGSGKSTIIAIISVIQALLMGTTVDIFTSSPVLAERDAKGWAKFYQLFHLTCSHNGDRGSGYVRGKKLCYEKDIVYGDTSQFQFDALRHEYSGLSTRGERSYSYAIVDEVDSMLIDDGSKLARLSSTLPGMDLLQVFYHLTWNRLHDVQRRLFALGPRMFYLEGCANVGKDGVHSYHFVDENDQICTIENLPLFILQQSEEDLERVKIQPVSEIAKFVSDHLKDYIHVLIGDKTFEGEENKSKIPLPKASVKYARTQVNHWVESAMTALTFEENVHYVIDEGQIKPVDFLTTGVIQKSTNWNNGLHQFLQIKHAIKVTTETVTTNFLSNGAMFKKYSGSLVGFTGTLGSSHGIQFLKDIYNVDAVIIPELYFKRFIRIRDQVCPTQAQWLSTVLHSAMHESSKSRGVLIICQTIKFSELIAQELRKSSKDPTRIKMYVRNGENQEKQVERVHPGDIIVATNLAGRGTDIKTVEVEKFGGLHVILTFLSESQRVEEQAFGRTSRQGNKGSGQLIVMSSEQAEELAKARDEAEREQLQTYKDSKLKMMMTKDQLFARFCTAYQKIREHLRGNPLDSTFLNRTWSGSKRLFGAETLTALELTTLRAVEELWAIFLKRLDDGDLELDQAMAAYEDFEEELQLENFSAEGSIQRTQNCFYWIQFGNEFYRRSGKTNNKVLEAEKYFERAINEEPDFSAGAYAGKAYTLLKGQVHVVKFNSHDEKYKETSIVFLTRALKLFYEEIAFYTTAQTLLQNRSEDNINSDLFIQLTTKIGLLGDYARNLSNILTTAKKSLRTVMCTAQSPGRETTVKLAVEMKQIPLQDYSSYTLLLHDLTAHHDMCTWDQAIASINRAAEKDINLSVGLEIDNQNLKTVAEVISDEVVQGASLKISGLQLDDIEELSTLSAKSFKLQFSSLVAEVENLAERLKIRSAGFQVSFEDVIDETPTIFNKSISTEDSVLQAFPTSVNKAKMIISYDEFQKLKSLATMLPNFTQVAITFQDVQLKDIQEKWNMLKNFSSNSIIISDLKSETARQLIPKLREKNLEFILRLENLLVTTANYVLEHSEDRPQEEIVQQGFKSLNEQFSAEFIPLDDLRDLAQRGIELMGKFNELAFVPWMSVITMAVLATVQIAAGAALICTGFGGTVGLNLITEGFSDVVTTWSAYSNREFNWTDFAKQKAVSLAISALTPGWGALKKAAKAAKATKDALKNAAKTALKKATKVAKGALKSTTKASVAAGATKVTQTTGALAVSQSKVLTEAVKISATKLQALAGRQVLVKGVETAGRAGLNSVVNALVEFSFEQVSGEIQAEINKSVSLQFSKTEFKEALAIYTAIDTIGQRQFSAKVLHWVNDITNPESGSWKKTWDDIGLPLIEGILSDSEHNNTKFSIGFRILAIVKGMHEIATAVDAVCNEILKNILMENQTNTPSQLIHSHCSVTLDAARDISTHMKFDSAQDFKVIQFPKQNVLDEHMVSSNDLKDLFNKLHKTKTSFKIEGNYDVSKVIKSVVDALTAHIIHVANSQVASPLTTLAVGKIVDGISREIQSRFIVSHSHMSLDQERALELQKRNPKSLNKEESEFLAKKGGKITVSDQIKSVAKDYTQAYKKHELVAKVLQAKFANPNEANPVNKSSEKAYSAIENALTGQPADVSAIIMLAKLNGQPIKVANSANFNSKREDTENDMKVILLPTSTKPGDIAHYSIKDPVTGEMKDYHSQGNLDCAYQALGDLTGKSVDELRMQQAHVILGNLEKYAQIQESAQWVLDSYPQDSSNLLMLPDLPKEQKRHKRRVGHYCQLL